MSLAFRNSFLAGLGVTIDRHGKMRAVIVHFTQKNWLVLIEAFTSHGPIDLKRHNELKELFNSSSAGLVFVTAFETRRAMEYLGQIGWEMDAWVAEAPSHIIHFNGERFLVPTSRCVQMESARLHGLSLADSASQRRRIAAQSICQQVDKPAIFRPTYWA